MCLLITPLKKLVFGFSYMEVRNKEINQNFIELKKKGKYLSFTSFYEPLFFSFRTVRWRGVYVYTKCMPTVPCLQKRQFVVQILPNLRISLNLLRRKWDLTAHKRALQLYFCACYCEQWDLATEKQIILSFSSVILKLSS